MNQVIREYVNRARFSGEVWSDRRRCEMASLYTHLHPTRAKVMLVRVGYKNGVLLGFNLERGPRSRPFASQELAVLDALAPLVQVGDALWRSRHVAPGVRAWLEQWKLTRREAEIAELVMRGLQNHEIAQALGLAPNTVRNALARIFPKAEVSTRAELVFLAHQSQDKPAERTARTTGQASNEMDSYFEKVLQASGLVRSTNGDSPNDHDRRAITYIAPASEL